MQAKTNLRTTKAFLRCRTSP